MRYPVLFLCLFYLSAATSQDEADITRVPAADHFRPGVFLSLNLDNETGDFYTIAAASLQNAKHAFSIGPSFPVERSSGKKELGAECMYRYYPNSSRNRFNLYLFADLSFMFSRSRGTYKEFNYYWSPVSDIVRYDNRGSLIKLGMGYGLQVKITKRIQLLQHNGLGAATNGSTTSRIYNVHTEKNSEYVTRPGGDFGLFFFASLGAGFCF